MNLFNMFLNGLAFSAGLLTLFVALFRHRNRINNDNLDFQKRVETRLECSLHAHKRIADASERIAEVMEVMNQRDANL